MDYEKDELISLLQNNEAFSTAPPDVLEELVDASEIRELSPSEDLIHQGASGESIWLLLEGHLDVLVGDQLVNEIDQRGDVVGEISAISLTPATATATPKRSTPSRPPDDRPPLPTLWKRS